MDCRLAVDGLTVPWTADWLWMAWQYYWRLFSKPLTRFQITKDRFGLLVRTYSLTSIEAHGLMVDGTMNFPVKTVTTPSSYLSIILSFDTHDEATTFLKYTDNLRITFYRIPWSDHNF